MLDDGHYRVDNVLVDWQRNAIDEEVMSPIAIKVDREKRLVEFLQE